MPMLRARTLNRALVFATMLSWAAPAAADVTIGGSCSGTVGYGPQSNGNNAACVSSLWQYPAYTVGNTSASCSSTDAGELKYTGGVLSFCNSSNWQTVLYGTTTATTPIFAAGAGYVVLTSGSWNGNFGGLSGANADCLSDLTANNWMGKSTAVAAGQLTSGNVVAWLCNSSSCNNWFANSTYYFAASGNTSAGGATITTDATGVAGYSGSYYSSTSDGNQWSAVNYFDTTATYWTGNGPDYASWVPYSYYSGNTAYYCNDWTNSTTSDYGIDGISTASNVNRWTNAAVYCTSTLQLICLVQP
jgi:hypothetical protein